MFSLPEFAFVEQIHMVLPKTSSFYDCWLLNQMGDAFVLTRLRSPWGEEPLNIKYFLNKQSWMREGGSSQALGESAAKHKAWCDHIK